MSKTEQYQQYIDDQLTRVLVEAQNAAEYSGAARKVHDFLLDSDTLATPDFVLRRHLFRTEPQMFVSWPEMTEQSPWDADVVNGVVKQLGRLDLSFTPKVWRSYLRGNTKPDTRQKALRLAVLTKMDLDTTQCLLMALDMPTLNMRFPLDFLCYPAFRSPGTITWAQIEEGVARFREEHRKTAPAVQRLIPGQTQMLEASLENLIRNEENVAERLRQYMDENADAFLDTEQKELAAYSATTQEKFLHLSRMLAILYPYAMDKANGRSDLHMGIVQKVEQNGTPSLQKLAKAMLFLEGWMQIWKVQDEKDPKKMDELEASLYRLQENYVGHMACVDRAIRGEKGEHAFFTRNDGLLFAYFFIQGYRNLCDGVDVIVQTEPEYNYEEAEAGSEKSEDARKKAQEKREAKKQEMNAYFAGLPTVEERIDKLHALAEGEDTLSCCMAEVMDRWDAFAEMKDGEEPEADEMYRETLNGLNLILEGLGQRKIYILSRNDRLVLLALLSNAPTELFPLIVSPQNRATYDEKNHVH